VLVPPEAGELLARLVDDEVPYVVIGGVAVNLLGYERMNARRRRARPGDGHAGAGDPRASGAARGNTPGRDATPDALLDGQHQIRALTSLGIVDFVPKGGPPLTFEEVTET
jgi:hypothetical protein